MALLFWCVTEKQHSYDLWFLWGEFWCEAVLEIGDRVDDLSIDHPIPFFGALTFLSLALCILLGCISHLYVSWGAD